MTPLQGIFFYLFYARKCKWTNAQKIMPFCIIYTTVYSRVADALAKILKHDYLSKAAKMKAASVVVNSIKRRKEHLPIMHCGNYSHFWLLSSIDTISSRHRRDSRLCQTSYGSSPSFWYTKGALFLVCQMVEKR